MTNQIAAAIRFIALFQQDGWQDTPAARRHWLLTCIALTPAQILKVRAI